MDKQAIQVHSQERVENIQSRHQDGGHIRGEGDGITGGVWGLCPWIPKRKGHLTQVTPAVWSPEAGRDDGAAEEGEL